MDRQAAQAAKPLAPMKRDAVTRDRGFGKAAAGPAAPLGRHAEAPVIFSLFKRRKASPAETLYRHVAQASRRPSLYLLSGIPDTAEGRFESLSLHVALVLRRLNALPAPAATIGQDLVEIFFRELDRGLRELGVGDLSVAKRIKKLAKAFYGRLNAYDEALAVEGDALRAALARNVLDDETRDAARLTAYVRTAANRLGGMSLADLLRDEPLLDDIEP